MDRWMIKSMDYSVQYWIEIVQSINGKKDKERKREKMIENRNREKEEINDIQVLFFGIRIKIETGY